MCTAWNTRYRKDHLTNRESWHHGRRWLHHVWPSLCVGYLITRQLWQHGKSTGCTAWTQCYHSACSPWKIKMTVLWKKFTLVFLKSVSLKTYYMSYCSMIFVSFLYLFWKKIVGWLTWCVWYCNLAVRWTWPDRLTGTNSCTAWLASRSKSGNCDGTCSPQRLIIVAWSHQQLSSHLEPCLCGFDNSLTC